MYYTSSRKEKCILPWKMRRGQSSTLAGAEVGPSARRSGALLARKFQAWETRHRTFNNSRTVSTVPLRPCRPQPPQSRPSPSSSPLLIISTLKSLNDHGPYQGQLYSYLRYHLSDVVVDDSLDSKPLASPPEVGMGLDF